MLGDLRVDQLSEMRFEPLMRPFLIDAHKPGIPGYIGGEDGGETADRRHSALSGNVP